MIGRAIFAVAHHIAFPDFQEVYAEVMRDSHLSREERQEKQNRRMRTSLNYAYESVPYYHRIFRKHNIKPEDMRTTHDLRKLPILTKEDIRTNWDDLKPIGLEHTKYGQRATGGTTGTPLTYRISNRDRMMSVALLYRGWGYAGYRPGDKMVYLAGSSLGTTDKLSRFPNKKELARNARMLSSFDMDDARMGDYVNVVNSFRPKFVRGYPSSLDLFSRWIAEHRTRIHSPSAIFVTSERLYPEMKTNIEAAFNCDVFDNYGLNDGGVSAFECSEHSGLHVDMERSVMEIVDDFGNPIDEGEGRVLATSLTNEAMPFIRYDTGDIARIDRIRCGCGNFSDLLSEVVGRTTDMLHTPDGRAIHGWFFLYIFWKLGKGIKQYQVVQETLTRIVINIVPDDDFDEAVIDEIRKISHEKCESWEIEFRMRDCIPASPNGKTRFISSRVAEKTYQEGTQ